ncbi:MAG: universal stress protein [Magnetovibrio sp.]|nr:universal stress protein [Magnetovibrio sp.]
MFANFTKILYCTDMSQTSIHAFGYAAQLAKLSGAEVHILHVVEELSSDAKVTLQTYIMNEDDRRRMLDERVAQAKAAVEERQDKFWAGQDAADQAVRGQIKSVEVCEAYPAEQILKSSIELGCDLIIMGAHEKGLTHTFLGGVAKSVLRRSRVPALIVPLP